MKKIDLIVPCYNESEVIGIFYEAVNNITKSINGYEFNYIFIDDGSSDNTLKILEDFSKKDDKVKYISFSRNFGKESAMYAGLKNSDADYCLILDSDMQHPPALIPQMIKGIEEGYDCCACHRATREGDPKMRTFFTRKFYALIDKISDVKMPDGAGDFRLMSRNMVNAVLAMSEVQRFSKGIFSWVGFNTKWIPFENVERAAGQTKWNFWKLFKYALDGITAFSTVPLRFASYMGMLTSASAFVFLIYIIIKTLYIGKDIPGYASTIAILLFIGGIILLSLGILGEYIAKIYLEVKNRPIYIIGKTNFENPKDDYK